MKIGILGSGNVGGTLGKAWSRLGHEVFFGLKNPQDQQAKALVTEAAGTAKGGTVQQAAAAADVLVLATPWEAAEAVLASIANDLPGKILIDASNPLLPGLAGLSVGTATSAGEKVAVWAPGARVVKAFNTVGFNIMAASHFPDGPVALFYCGDDPEAKKIVARLATELGFEALDAGPITQCRVLEPFAMLWISLALKYGYGRDIGFRLIRRN